MGEDGRRTAPAALRNETPIINALRARLPAQGRVLEVASGTGQHAAAFAAAFPDLQWAPSDVDDDQRKSIAAWRRSSGLRNLAAPLALDVAAPWPVTRSFAQVVLTVNVMHLISSDAMLRFFQEARAALADDGRAIIYGPFVRDHGYASDGDAEFDAALRARDARIGYKSLSEISHAAQKSGFAAPIIDTMPANNLLLTFAVA